MGRPLAWLPTSWFGQKQYQVFIDLDRLLKYDVTFDQVVRARTQEG